ncbi:hypothetical protein [Phocaeicola coprophilus]|jgi:hypothetical protein|uniref:hypothetical protein n=1 Tax=Phocaeicola coprophilus TaxID=387090 RepID=UPI00242D1605|nr:hypothetical protein [Phocaeicola coprophilus]
MAKTEHLNSEQNIESIISAPLVALSKANMMMLSGQTDILSEKALYRGRLNGTDRDGKTPVMKGLEVSVETSSQPLSRGLLTVMELYEKAIRASVPLRKTETESEETNL